MSYKYDFIDKNPYLTYTDEPNKTYSDIFGVYSDNPESADDEGGGGADLGELYPLYYFFESSLTVGDTWSDENLTPTISTSIGVGDSPLFNVAYGSGTEPELPNIAEGANIKSMWFTSEFATTFDGVYTVTVKTDGRDDTIGAVVDLNVTATTETETVEEETVTRYAFTVPPKPVAADIPLAEGESIYAVYNCVYLPAQGEGV